MPLGLERLKLATAILKQEIIRYMLLSQNNLGQKFVEKVNKLNVV